MLVVDYDPSWPQQFAALKASLWPALGDLALAIEHVGSTSVVGLAAKPVIDLDVVVADADFAEGVRRLEQLGYQHEGDRGIPLRAAFARPARTVPHHLYLCPPHSPALANHLALRSHLRAHPEVARAYGELKQRLAVEHARDMAAYVAGKTPFIVNILGQLGFPAAALADIELMNRGKRDIVG